MAEIECINAISFLSESIMNNCCVIMRDITLQIVVPFHMKKGSKSLTVNTKTDTSNMQSPLGSPVSGASNIRNKVRDMQRQLHNHHATMEDTNIELKRVRQMLDPLRLSMKRYTDQLETNTNKNIKEVVEKQNKENNKMDADIQTLQNENTKLKDTIAIMQKQMENMASSISQLQGQVFGNYDSECEALARQNNENDMTRSNAQTDKLQ
eukprot:124202_1